MLYRQHTGGLELKKPNRTLQRKWTMTRWKHELNGFRH